MSKKYHGPRTAPTPARRAARKHPVPARMMERLETRVLFAAGDVDTSFGAGGTAAANFGSQGFSSDVVVDASRGRVLVVGVAGPADSDFNRRLAVAAFKLDGRPDTSFSGDGKLLTDLKASAAQIELLPDGRLYVAGTSRTSDGNVTQRVARLTAGGSYDNSFSGDGRLTLNTSAVIAAAPGNKLVLARVSGANAVLTRYTAGGSLDNTLGGDGSVSLDYLPGEYYDGGYDWTRIADVVVQPDNKIVLVGNVYGDDYWDGAVARVNANGTYDNSFDGDGRRIVVTGSVDDFATAAALAPDGDIFVGVTESESDAYVVRLAPNGANRPFNDPGVRQGTSDADVHDVSVARDGKVVVTGYADWNADMRPQTFLYRLGPGGGYDPGFGGYATGRLVYPVGIRHALDASGNIYVQNPDTFGVTKYRSSGGENAAGSVSLSEGRLSITGTMKGDEVRVSRSGTVITAAVNGYARTYSASRVTSVLVNAGDGGDDVRVASSISLPTTLNGGAGVDTIVGGAGRDRIDGGAGDGGETQRLDGGAGNDTLVGGDHGDHLVGGAGNDRLEGGGSFDSLDGGTGADYLSGGAGVDAVSYESRTNPVAVTVGSGADDGEAGERDDLRGDVEIVSGGSGDDRLVGNSADNHLRGMEGDDVILGLGGNDHLEGWEGNDRLEGGDGNDNLSGFFGSDTLLGGAGDDRLNDHDGTVLDGGPGSDSVNGVREDNVPTDGPIRLDEHDGTVYVQGTDGADVVRVSYLTSPSQIIRIEATFAGSSGTRRVDIPFSLVKRINVEAGDGDDRFDLSGVPAPISAVLDGRGGNDTLVGGEGDDVIRGYEGNDVLTGRAGNDDLDGGAGRDQLRGNAGDDRLLARGDNAVDFLDGGSGTDRAQKDNDDFAQFVEEFMA